MGERFLSVTPTDRAVEQAIVALKKGAHILKYGRREKPKLCPFRLSTDGRTLIWFSGKEEKQLRLSSVTSIIRGHRTRKLQPERECQSFSLIYMNNQGQGSLDLICKDKVQADSWFLGLETLIRRCQRSTPLDHFENRKEAQSCVSSPASYVRRKYNLGLLKETPKFSQVRSFSGSPLQSLSERCFSDGLSCSSDSFYSESSLSSKHCSTDNLVPNSPSIEPKHLKIFESINSTPKKPPKMLSRFVPPKPELSDVLIWGEAVKKGSLPKLLDSIGMLDVKSISLAGKRAGLVTKTGELFFSGEGQKVESLSAVEVKSLSCGEYQTCALANSGELYTWGQNSLPRRIAGVLDGICLSTVACGEWHTAVISNSGQLFTFGDGTFGVLGHGDTQSLNHPKQVESLKGMIVKSVACGPWHTAAVVETMVDRCKSSNLAGKLFTWGDGDNGRLGHVDHGVKVKPTCVSKLVDQDFIQVSCGRMMTVGLTNTGVVYTIGNSINGQDKSINLVQGKLKFEFVKEIAAGSYHIAVLTSKGNVYTWGRGAHGQLGVGDMEDRNSPTLVEALRDRTIERISCGSNSTAVICLHKSITCRMDQLACSGCRMAFGFMRKKHNCYNCGLNFCSNCSRKKIKNALLAPIESKSFRVCDSCFQGLERSNLEDISQRPLLTFEETDQDQAMVTQKLNKLRNNGDKGSPRWGQVSSPASFRKNCRDDSITGVSNLNDLNLDLRVSTLVNKKPDLMESDKIISQEVEKLRAQADNLERHCYTRDYKIKECQEVKRKVAKDVIKALTSRLHLMSPKFYMGKLEKGQVNTDRSLVISKCSDTPTVNAMQSMFSVEVKDVDRDKSTNMVNKSNLCEIEDRKVNRLCGSARTYSNEFRNPDCAQNKVNEKHEWIEQYQPGVFITFVILPNGEKGLKRVRFSRKRFTEKEAEKWWEDNQLQIYDIYDVDGYINSY